MSPRLSFPVTLTMGCLLWSLAGPMGAESPEPAPEPEVQWLSPLGGQRGTTLEVEIRGKVLGEAYAVISEEEGIQAHIRGVEEVVEENEEDPEDESEKKEPEYRVVVTAKIDPTARLGNHWLRLVTPQGVTNRVHFRVNGDRVIAESDAPA